MDRNVLTRLLRPRHVAASLLIFLALGGLSGAVVGFAVAEDEAPAEGFTFATPRVGDRGHYELSGAPHRMRDQAQTGLDFEVHPDVQGLDQIGRLLTMNRIGTREVPVEDAFHQELIYRIEPSTGQTVALEHGLDEVEPDERGVQTRRYVAVDFADPNSGWVPPCGLRHELQGTTWDLESRVAQTPCMFGPGPQNEGPWTWVADGVAEADGVTHLRAHITWAGASRLEFEFRSDLPYPVVVRLGRDSSEQTVLTLTAYEPGAGDPIALTAAPPGEPLPALQTADRTPWLVDDTGYDHPFPLSQAWARARDDPVEPAFRDFLADHPNALVNLASFSDYVQDGGGHQLTWYLTVSDGVQEMRLWVDAPVEPPAPANLTEDPVGALQEMIGGGGSPSQQAGYQYDVGDAHEGMPDPSLVPVQFPTLVSMMAQWDLHNGAAYEGVAGNHWRVDLWCSNDPCESSADIDIRLSVGHSVYVRDGDQDVSTSSTLEWSYWENLDRRLDLPYRYSEDIASWGPATAASGAAPESAPPASFTALTAGLAWDLPRGGAAASIGVSALVGAVVYWLLPALKGAPIAGLFSRLQRDRVLDNPLRQQLVQLVEAQPGVHHNELVRRLGRGKGTTEHHLEKLVGAGAIARHRGTGYTCYFPTGTDRRAMAATPATKADGARRILEVVGRGLGGVRPIAAATGLSPSTVSHHLERLRAAGLVVGDGRTGYTAVQGAHGAPAAA